MSKIIVAPVLNTDRLKLTDITENDAPVIVQWRSDPNVYQYFVNPHKITLEEHLNWFHNNYTYDANRYDWIAYSNNEPIGVFGIKRDSFDSDSAEISYILSPEHYGKGYAREAVERIIYYCKNDWNCSVIIADIHKDNFMSIKFIEHLCFVKSSINGKFIRYTLKL